MATFEEGKAIILNGVSNYVDSEHQEEVTSNLSRIPATGKWVFDTGETLNVESFIAAMVKIVVGKTNSSGSDEPKCNKRPRQTPNIIDIAQRLEALSEEEIKNIPEVDLSENTSAENTKIMTLSTAFMTSVMNKFIQNGDVEHPDADTSEMLKSGSILQIFEESSDTGTIIPIVLPNETLPLVMNKAFAQSSTVKYTCDILYADGPRAAFGNCANVILDNIGGFCIGIVKQGFISGDDEQIQKLDIALPEGDFPKGWFTLFKAIEKMGGKPGENVEFIEKAIATGDPNQVTEAMEELCTTPFMNIHQEEEGWVDNIFPTDANEDTD